MRASTRKEVQGSQAMQLRVPAGSAPGNRLLQESFRGALQEEGSAQTLKHGKEVEHGQTCHAPSESNGSIGAHWRGASAMRRPAPGPLQREAEPQDTRE